MGQVQLQKNAKLGLILGLGTAGIAAAGIWGSRYVSKLPNLPLKTAAVAGGSSFITTFAAFSLYNVADIHDDSLPIVLIGIILGSCALTASGNKTLVNRDISILSSGTTCAVSQIIVMAILSAISN